VGAEAKNNPHCRRTAIPMFVAESANAFWKNSEEFRNSDKKQITNASAAYGPQANFILVDGWHLAKLPKKLKNKQGNAAQTRALAKYVIHRLQKKSRSGGGF
jgi:hypothetical protein